MLCRNDDGIYARGDAVNIFYGYLRLAVGAKIWESLVDTHIAQTPRELVRERSAERHELGCFVAGIAKHHALIACADREPVVIVSGFSFERSAYAHVYIGGLVVDG